VVNQYIHRVGAEETFYI